MRERAGLVSRWRLIYTNQAQKDAIRLASSGRRPNAEQILKLLSEDPFRTPPRFEKLVGDLAGAYSRRINIQHRLVYQVIEEDRVVKVLRMWTHYE
jgi:toxin YoeB